MSADGEVVAASRESPCVPCEPGRCLQKGQPFYLRVRPFTVLCKLLATFPLQNVTARDGRDIGFKWISAILFYDFTCFLLVGLFFIFTSNQLIDIVDDEEEKFYLIVWMRFTIMAAGIRNFVQFIVCHASAHKYPELFQALEDFFQEIGAADPESRRTRIMNQVMPIGRTLVFLVFLFLSSFSFFYQFGPNSWLMSLSFVLVNLWKELPVSMFLCIFAHLRPHFDQVAKDLGKMRNCSTESDEEENLENARLRYAALTNILDLLEKCFGMQLAFIILFFVIDTILQLFIFIVFTSEDNIFLLTLSVYYFCTTCGVIFYIDRFGKRMDGITSALSALALKGKSDKIRYQVQLFTSQVILRPIKISASGFCYINNMLVCGLFGAIATYLIVMINFTPFIVEWANETIPKVQWVHQYNIH